MKNLKKHCACRVAVCYFSIYPIAVPMKSNSGDLSVACFTMVIDIDEQAINAGRCSIAESPFELL